jgi:fluoride exporter
LVSLLTWAAVAVFGALGAAARFRVDAAVSARWPSDFPLGTLVFNLSGAVPLGLLVGAAVPHRMLLVLGTGFLGGYTTFSTWMVESERLGEIGDVVLLLANLFLSLLLGFGLAALAWHVGHAVG